MSPGSLEAFLTGSSSKVLPPGAVPSRVPSRPPTAPRDRSALPSAAITANLRNCHYCVLLWHYYCLQHVRVPAFCVRVAKTLLLFSFTWLFK